MTKKMCYFSTDWLGNIMEPVMVGCTRIFDAHVDTHTHAAMNALCNENEIVIRGKLRPEWMGNECGKYISNSRLYSPTRVITKDRATIVFWDDDTKTVVKCCEDDWYNFDAAIIWAMAKKAFGTISQVHAYLEKLKRYIYISNYDALYMYFLVKDFDGDVEQFTEYLNQFEKIKEALDQ